MSARAAAEPAALFSAEELASWSRLCRQEALAELHKRDSWYYAFDRHVSSPGPGGLPYQLARQTQDPPGRSFSTRGSPSYTLTHTSLPAPISSVAFGCVAPPTRRHHRALLVHMFGENMVCGDMLQLTERPTPLDPFHTVGLAYVVVKPPVVKARKFLLIEHSGSAEDADGQLVVFKIVRSLPVCPGKFAQVVPGTAELEFGDTYITFFLHSSDSGRRTDMKVHTMSRLDPGVPGWAASKLGGAFLEGMERMGTAGASRVLQERLRGFGGARKQGKARKASTSSRPGSACHVCLRRKLRLGHSTRPCAGCERPTCKACMQQLFFLAGDKGDGTVKMRYCQPCVLEALAAGGRVDVLNTSGGSLTSGSSRRTLSDGVDVPVWKRKPRSASTVEYSK